MFFNAKRLMAQKQKVNEMIQAEHKKMDLVYHELTNSLHKMYPNYQCFDMFDITTVDFWLGDVACCYDGDNFDLSNAFFRLNEQLSDVEAEAMGKQQLIGIYNIFTVLINDLYAHEEPLLIQTEIDQQMVLDKFRVLTQKLIANLKNDQSASVEGLCTAVQKLFTLLDFSLYESPEHLYLRQLKKQFLQIQTTGYNNIDSYRQKIEEIDKQLEKHNYSEDGRKLSKRDIAPFPTLKAYNNAMKLLGGCLLAVEKYEKEGSLLAPSCSDDISEILLERFVRAKDEFDEWDDTVNFEKVAHTMLANATFDMLASGRYHLYAGILNPLNCSSTLMLVYDKAMSYGVRIGMITEKEKAEQRDYLQKCISEVG